MLNYQNPSCRCKDTRIVPHTSVIFSWKQWILLQIQFDSVYEPAAARHIRIWSGSLTDLPFTYKALFIFQVVIQLRLNNWPATFDLHCTCQNMYIRWQDHRKYIFIHWSNPFECSLGNYRKNATLVEMCKGSGKSSLILFCAFFTLVWVWLSCYTSVGLRRDPSYMQNLYQLAGW